ncbi:hypothetical protein NPIL_258731, partial [Nephila pilipes]
TPCDTLETCQRHVSIVSVIRYNDAVWHPFLSYLRCDCSLELLKQKPWL